jgi:phosphate transport system protein
MPEVRQRFHEELRAVEGEVQQTGAQARLLLDKALGALASGDLGLCGEVIDGDDEVDRLYLDVERRILHLFALQTPVASDLRLLTALLHINLHLERVGDQAVNLAKITTAAAGLPQNPPVLQDLVEMGAAALGMVGAAMEALARRDLALARQLPELDDPIDELNRGMLAKVLAVSDDQRMLEWGVRMYVVSRQIERIGDNAVDIGRAGGLPDYRTVPRVHRCFASGDRTPQAGRALRRHPSRRALATPANRPLAVPSAHEARDLRKREPGGPEAAR